MAKDSFEKDQHPAGEKTIVPDRWGSYDPRKGEVVVSSSGARRILSESNQTAVINALKSEGRGGDFDEWCLVALLAEEIGHFVQHTRGELSTHKNVPVQYSDEGINIFDETGEQDMEQLNDVVKVLFRAMDYRGKAPKLIKIVKNTIDVEFIGQSDYLKDIQAGIHSETFDFERAVREAQSEVLYWYCTHVLKMKKYITLVPPKKFIDSI